MTGDECKCESCQRPDVVFTNQASAATGDQLDKIAAQWGLKREVEPDAGLRARLIRTINGEFTKRRWVIDTHHPLYCYEPQWRSVASIFIGDFVPQGSLYRLTLPEQLMGLEGGTFAYIQNHPQPVPQSLWYVLRANGWSIISYSDEWKRDRMGSRS